MIIFSEAINIKHNLFLLFNQVHLYLLSYLLLEKLCLMKTIYFKKVLSIFHRCKWFHFIIIDLLFDLHNLTFAYSIVRYVLNGYISIHKTQALCWEFFMFILLVLLNFRIAFTDHNLTLFLFNSLLNLVISFHVWNIVCNLFILFLHFFLIDYRDLFLNTILKNLHVKSSLKLYFMLSFPLHMLIVASYSADFLLHIRKIQTNQIFLVCIFYNQIL